MDVRPPRKLNQHISYFKLHIKSGYPLAPRKHLIPPSPPLFKTTSFLAQLRQRKHPPLSSPPPPKKEKKLTLQSLQPRFSQSILRQHPSNRPLQHLSPAPLPHHPLHIQALQRPRPRRLLIIQLLLHLPSRHIQVCASCGYHIIPAISRWVPDRFMFTH